MFDKLDDLLVRFEELLNELGEPGVTDDPAHFQKLMKEQSDLQPIVDAYKEYKKNKETIEDSLSMLESEKDEEMREMLKEELSDAKKNGYEAYVFFVIQMKGVRYFTPNTETHPQFAEALQKTAKEGVKVLAYDCDVTSDAIELSDAVDVVLGNPILKESVRPLVEWFRENKRDLPWRKRINAYRVWISEIMLQQTRVEAVKPYFQRFIGELPDVQALAECPEEKLMKLWEGLGYYNRVRNMQMAARTVVFEYEGKLPAS